MFIDVCIPKNNEEKYIEIAEKLDTKGLLFLYEKNKTDLDELRKKTKVKLFSGFLISKNPGKEDLYFAKGERKNVENKKLKFLYGFESLEAKDSFHYRRGGMNQVIAKLVKTKEKIVVLDMEKTITANEPETFLGRMTQNLMMIKKYKLQLIICSFATNPMNLRASKDYEALIRSLGYQEEAKKAVNLLSDVLQ